MIRDQIKTKRKVQQLGASTLAVTLPAEWVHEQGIEKGEEVIIQRDESGGSLLVVPDEPSDGDRSVAIDADGMSREALERAVVAQYVLGRQIITVDSERALESEHYDGILDAEQRLIGLGVVEETEHRITIRCSVAPGDFELPQLLERLGRTESSMRSDAFGAFLDGDGARARRARKRERRMDKLFSLFLRLVFTTYRNPRLNQSVGLETGFPLIGYRSAAWSLVLMADTARHTAELAADADGETVAGTTRERLESGIDAMDRAVEASLAAAIDPTYEGIEAANEALEAANAECAAIREYIETERPERAVVLDRVVIYLLQIGTYAAGVSDVATHLVFRQRPEDVP